MPFSLSDRLLRRESGSLHQDFQLKSLYGNSQFVEDLDIVNELSGHEGCVNALSWARSGRLLASGSDDRIVNIYSYLPDHSSSQFSLATKIDTGHAANIFSVKFMPHSNDNKIVTCAGDEEIRVFDIERSARSNNSTQSLDMGTAKGKVFRSHTASVKRIVTEASPFYFLSCSEDGEVRQWDIRQPSSYYPRSISSRRALTHGATNGQRNEAPPPLISYADYRIELYTISCSPSQPHYIALGGTHIHCFLHDRRMMGRDRLKERGGRLPVSLDLDSSLQQLSEATQCVAKFAPHGQPKMNKTDSKTITACKLGNAKPNELIVSWTGDHIYSFNILKPQSEAHIKTYKTKATSKSNDNASSLRKRKRIPADDSPSAGPNFRERATDLEENDPSRPEISISLQLSNGESIELPINSRNIDLPEPGETIDSDDPGAPHAQRIRALKNYMSRTHFGHGEEDHRDEMRNILTASKEAFEHIDEQLAHQTYPVTSAGGIIEYEKKLRSDRAKVWRFTQSSGVLARVLLGSGQIPQLVPVEIFQQFDIIKPAPCESSMPLDRHEQFGYDFAKAILLWLESGPGTVLKEFSSESRYANAGTRSRFPVSRDADIKAIDIQLIPYLENLATDLSIDYSGHGGGTNDDPRRTDTVFASEKAAVRAFAVAIKQQFEDLQSPEPNAPAKSRTNFQWKNGQLMRSDQTSQGDAAMPSRDQLLTDRKAAVKFWGHRVCMAVLNRAAIDVNFPFVATAFGNAHLGIQQTPTPTTRTPSAQPSRSNPVDGPASYHAAAMADLLETSSDDADYVMDTEDEADAIRQLVTEVHSDSVDEHDENDEDSSDDGYAGPSKPRFSAGKNVPCYSHTKSYQGHCNVETTKDVNFYGLSDEYVVSGSDCGNFFIWERETGRLVNILNGDCEVVNVIQPHPYEPMLAVSGIDSTVKIFSPDHRARRLAAKARGVTAADKSTFTSINYPQAPRRRNAISGPSYSNPQHENGLDKEDISDLLADLDDLAEAPVSTRGLESRKRMDKSYEITSRNDMERRTGMQHSYVSRTMLELLQSRLGQQINVEDLQGDENCIVM